jgi:hypothetical protein
MFGTVIIKYLEAWWHHPSYFRNYYGGPRFQKNRIWNDDLPLPTLTILREFDASN